MKRSWDVAGLKERIENAAAVILDTHLELIALLIAQTSRSEEEQRECLDNTISILLNCEVVDTIFENGRRLPARLIETPRPHIQLNGELLGRVSDDQLALALSRVVADHLSISSMTLALALRAQDEPLLLQLTSRTARSLDSDVVNVLSVPNHLGRRLEQFRRRLTYVAKTRGGDRDSCTFDAADRGALLERLKGAKRWPDWMDVSDLDFAAKARELLKTAETEPDAGTSGVALEELVWSSLGVSPQTFLRQAGQSIRSAKTTNPQEILELLFGMLGDISLERDISSWDSLREVSQSLAQLEGAEQALFGGFQCTQSATASVVDPPATWLGLSESGLPLEWPLLCWTLREQNALRDLIRGCVRMLPGGNDAEFSFPPTKPSEEFNALNREEPANVQIRLSSRRHATTPADPREIEAGWSAAYHDIINHYEVLSDDQKVVVMEELQDFYTVRFPFATQVWERRFSHVKNSMSQQAFGKVVGMLRSLLGVPALVDPFSGPDNTAARVPSAVIVVPAPRSGTHTTFFQIPISLIWSTRGGESLRMRVTTTEGAGAGQVRWLLDRGLHFDQLQDQGLDKIADAIESGSLFMSIAPLNT
jgi:hypothetical protein